MLLQLSERDNLPKLKTKSKLIKLQEEIHGIIEERSEDETDINTMVAQKVIPYISSRSRINTAM